MPQPPKLLLKRRARKLRVNMTDAEQKLWYRLRRKQLCDVQFYRQRPVGSYIVDFYAPSVKLIVEVDGGQHFDSSHLYADRKRDAYLTSRGFTILRFDNLQVLKQTESVVEEIERVVRLCRK